MFLLLLALFVFPLAVYCTLLGMINRRLRPLLVSGAWDFLGVLFATSGFLLFLGPALLSGAFRDSLNKVPFDHSSGTMSGAVAGLWAEWWAAWLLYYVLVLGGGAYLVWLRRRTTVIYNIDARTFETVLARVAQRLDLRSSRLGNRLFLGVSNVPVPLTGAAEPAAIDVSSHVTAQPPAADTSSHVTAEPPSAGTGESLRELTAGTDGQQAAKRPVRLVGEQVIVDVDAFEMLSNVSLHWRSASPVARANLERELRTALAEAEAQENAVSTWLLGIATLLFLIVIMMTTTFVILAVRQRWS